MAITGMNLNDYVIVLADDDPEIRSTYGALFTAKGYAVHACADGAQALALCKEFRPAVALIDLDMPVLDGYETAKQLRADPELAGMRIIAIAGRSDERSSARAWDAGFHEFLAKPVPTSMLLSIVRPTRELQGVIQAIERAKTKT